MLRILLIIFLFLVIIGMLPSWPYSEGWGYGYYPSGGLGLLLIVLLVFFFMGRRRI